MLLENAGMDFIAWIKEGLKKPGKTQSGLAKKLGRADSAISAMLNDARKIKAHEIELIADYLELEAPFTKAKRIVPILGCVRAGGYVEITEDEKICRKVIAVPAGGNEARAALLVEGASMPGLIRAGWAVFYGEACSPPSEDQIGELCVCTLSDGRMVVGFLKHSLYSGLFDLEIGAAEPLLAQRVNTAAAVTNIVTKAAVSGLISEAANEAAA